MVKEVINMKIILVILVLISVQSFGQTRLYAIKGNLDGTRDSFYRNETICNGIYNSTGNYIAPCVDSVANIYGYVLPASFGNFFLCADGIYRNSLALTGVRVSVIAINANGAANLELTNHPNSEQPLANSQRSAVAVQAYGYTEARLTAIVMVGSASVNSPRIYLQYSTDGVNWSGNGSGGNISLSSTGAKETAWITLPEEAIGNIYVRVAQNGGNGTLDPALGNITIQLR